MLILQRFLTFERCFFLFKEKGAVLGLFVATCVIMFVGLIVPKNTLIVYPQKAEGRKVQYEQTDELQSEEHE